MIVASAVVVHPKNSEYPVIFTGLRHSDCLEKAFKFYPDRNKELDIQGFIDENFCFMDRYEAKYHARLYNQLVNDSEDRALYSEDIWPE